MFKKITVAISIMMMYLFTGCIQPDIYFNENRSDYNFWGPMTNVDDVDMSDMEGNLTESEMMMTENGEINKIIRMDFPESEYSSLKKMGRGTLKGTVYLVDSKGKKVLGKNTRLYLNPITSYSEQWYTESYMSGYLMEKADGRLFNYLKFTSSNNDGKFAFYGVPTGSYYLIGTVRCGKQCGYLNMKNIRIATEVELRGRESIVQDLTRIDN